MAEDKLESLVVGAGDMSGPVMSTRMLEFVLGMPAGVFERSVKAAASFETRSVCGHIFQPVRIGPEEVSCAVWLPPRRVTGSGSDR